MLNSSGFVAFQMVDFLMKLPPEVLAAFLSALATLLAFVATCASAWAAMKGPVVAAEIAEKMRRDHDVASESRRNKLNIFAVLMSERAEWYTPEAVRAFNLIDIVYNESQGVRDAWAELFSALDPAKNIPEHEKNKRHRTLLVEMARDLNLSDRLRLDDFERFYLPNALQEEQQVKFLQRQESLKKLRGELAPSANTAPISNTRSFFPPPPIKS